MRPSLTDQAKKIGHRDFQVAMVGAEQQLANAVSSIATQLSLINQKLDLLIEAIEERTPQT
jgi:hypothetical protein